MVLVVIDNSIFYSHFNNSRFDSIRFNCLLIHFSCLFKLSPLLIWGIVTTCQINYLSTNRSRSFVFVRRRVVDSTTTTTRLCWTCLDSIRFTIYLFYLFLFLSRVVISVSVVLIYTNLYWAWNQYRFNSIQFNVYSGLVIVS